jgi:hypothetical protein
MTGVIQTTANEDFIRKLRRICESTNISFLLGAGCSMPAFGTLGNIETLREMLDDDDSIDEHQKLLIQASLDAAFFLKSIYPNLEYLDNKTSDADVLATKENYSSFTEYAMNLVRFRESPLLARQVTFFVTNYDICMDYALDEAAVPTNAGHVGRFNKKVVLDDFGRRINANTLTYGYQSEIASANIVKLHGCVSWRNIAGQLHFTDVDTALNEIFAAIKSEHLLKLDRQHEDETDEEQYNRLKTTPPTVAATADQLQALIDKIAEPQLVLPNKTKFKTTVLSEVYYAQLRRMTNQLEVRNTTLIVVGFSFADEHIRKLIIRSANANPTLNVIVICFNKKAAEDIRANLEDEAQYPIKNSNVLLVLPENPEDPTDCLNLNALSKILRKLPA